MAATTPAAMDIREKYEIESCKKILVTKRPRNGFDGEVERGAGALDCVLILLRALTAYGWRPPATLNPIEAAVFKTAMMDLGWDEDLDKKRKADLVALFPPRILINVSLIVGEDLRSLIEDNELFELKDRLYLNLEDGGEWEWKEYGPSRTVFQWNGKRSIQDAMDHTFDTREIHKPAGTKRTVRVFGKCARFIYVQYAPVKSQKFEDLCRFDLHTLCVGDKVPGQGEKRDVCRQEAARFHILAISIQKPGFNDVRIYNQANSVITETTGYKTTSPRGSRNWTVECMDPDTDFILIYYRVKNLPELGYTLDDIPYRPIEFDRTDDEDEDAAEKKED